MAEHNAYKKYMDADHKTRGAAIKAMCAHCMGCNADHMEPGHRALVRECVSTGCPLHNFRPWQGKDDGHEDSEQELAKDIKSF